ncbi:MAG TPA: MotA/TolQ/ExbB proton channel family protein [Thermoguttaceae bacterium]|nr:MotA/TolQ/ExbB proton channel family protein [Thermoguttaceae bacterium]
MNRTIASPRPEATWWLAAVMLIGMGAAAALWQQAARAEETAVNASADDAKTDDSRSATEKSADDGKAIPTKNLWEIIRSGGVLMIPIAICSFILLMFVLERAISLRRNRVIPGPFVKRFLKQLGDGELDRPRALELCAENGSPVADVFAGAVRKWGRPAVEVEQAIIDSGERATNGLRRYLRVINGVATVAPLLGLLGTVVGMIRAFNEIAVSEEMGRPKLLAEGIGEALLTTAAGLTVAIPALICYLFFVSRVDRLIIDIDAMGQEVVNLISAEELQEKKENVNLPKARRNNRCETAA